MELLTKKIITGFKFSGQVVAQTTKTMAVSQENPMREVQAQSKICVQTREGYILWIPTPDETSSQEMLLGKRLKVTVELE